MAKVTARGMPGRVRIVAGMLRGSVLAVPEVPGLRPTPARVRETLFNWLRAIVPGASCLDMFAGSGALGIEALSRGAARVCFIERDRHLAAALRANLERLGQPVDVHCGDALALLEHAPPAAMDVVFVDPPFARELWDAAAARLESRGWLAPRAWIYVEMPVGMAFAPPPTWELYRGTRAGNVACAVYRRQAAHSVSWMDPD